VASAASQLLAATSPTGSGYTDMSYAQIVWWVSFVAVVLTGLANEANEFPPAAHHYIQVASLIIGLVMAYLKQSPLPPSQPTVTTAVDPNIKPFIR
jgi:hypothetical protein